MDLCWDFIAWGDASGWAQAIFGALAILYSVQLTNRQILNEQGIRDAEAKAQKEREDTGRLLREKAAVAMLYGDMQLVASKMKEAHRLTAEIAKSPHKGSGFHRLPERMSEVAYLTSLEGRIVELNPALCAEVSDIVSMLRMFNEKLGPTNDAGCSDAYLQQLDALAAGICLEFDRTLPNMLALHPNPARFTQV